MTDDLTPEQETEKDLAARGVLPFTIDGHALELPVLKMRAAREWRASVQERFTALTKVAADSPEGNEAMATAQTDLVLSYDRTGVLGGREWLDEHATDEDLDRLYNTIMEKSFRFVGSQAALVLTIIQRVVASELAKSTNGSLPTGTSTSRPPKRSKTASPSPS